MLTRSRFLPRHLWGAAFSLSLSVLPECYSAPLRVLPLGDSLTEACPGYRGPLLAALLADGHEVEFIGPKQDAASRHAGFAGYTIGPGPSKADAWSDGQGNLHAQLDALLGKDSPDLILLLIGVNDFFNIGDLDPAYAVERDGPLRLAALLDRIHALSPRSRVLYSSVLPVEWDAGFAAAYNRQLPALAASRPFAQFVPLHEKVGFVPGDWTDQLHLGASGNAKLARAWADCLQSTLNATPALTQK
jgi:lysophospholipase L1-like esterase